MASCYDVVRRTLVAFLVSLVASAATAAAQSMYLDANSDGVHTSADVVPTSGSWTFDVWLSTDRNRDGERATCAQTGDSLFTLRSYSFVLGVSNGTIRFVDVTNRVPELTETSPSRSSETELVYGRFAQVELPSGRYRLATVTAEVTSGTPALGILPISTGSPTVVTSFESSCFGEGYDGLLKLGVDWFDADGLRYGGQANLPPVLDPIASMTVAEADTVRQAIRATDPDFDEITISKIRGPSFVLVSTTSSSPGTAVGAVEVMPGYSDAGADSAAVRATDGILSVEQPFRITVTNVNRPPTFEQPSNQQVEAGTRLEVPLVLSDPDGIGSIFLTIVGPPFASLDGHRVVLEPDPREPGADHAVTVRASDGMFTIERVFTVTVFGTKHPPTLETISEMVAAESDTVLQDVRAYDPDADLLTFSPLQFPAFMALDILSMGPVQPLARIVLTPRAGDHGSIQVGVSVSDGYSTDERWFEVTVLERGTGSTFLTLEASPRPDVIPWERTRFGPRDGVFNASGSPKAGASVTFVPPTSEAQDYEVELSCYPAQRAQCYSDPQFWSVTFQPPLGRALSPGLYTGTGHDPDSTHAALRVGQFCGVFFDCPTSNQSWFRIEQVIYAATGELLSLWARFERRCTDPGLPVLSGEVRYRAVRPAFTDPPSRLTADTGSPVEAAILVGGTATGPIVVTSPDLPAGASLTPVLRNRTGLDWVPELEQAGSHEIHLIASVDGVEPDTSVMVVCVSIPGAVSATMDMNRTELTTGNRGDAVHEEEERYGAYHPAGSGTPVARSAAFILAGEVNGELRVARGGCDFVPGPTENGMAAPFEPSFKSYTIRDGQPFGYDWDHWPIALGAPVDDAGNPAVFGDATIWSVYNEARLPGPGEPARWTAPIGIEIRQTTWAEGSTTALGDVVFQRYHIVNAGSSTLENAYVAWDVSPTTWDTYGGHVAVYSRNAWGCDTTLSLGYAYSSVYGGEPNAFGVAVLQGPSIPLGGAVDTLGLTAFTEAYYSTPVPLYYLMQGYGANGLPRHEYDDLSRPVTTFAYSGDPISGSGWLAEGYPFTNALFLASSGPFRLAPGEEQEVVVAFMGTTGNDRLEAVSMLRAAARVAQSALHRYAEPPPNRPPLADAGGPYSGRSGEPVAFDGTGSSDPEGQSLSFDWSFGDGSRGAGAQPVHSYEDDGVYRVALQVSDGYLSDSDSTQASIATVDTAGVVLLPGDPVIRLRSSRPLVYMSLEPRPGAFEISEVTLESITLTRPDRPGLTIHPVVGKAKVEDRDRDGAEELALAFTKTDVRVLFGDLAPGLSDVPVTVQGVLTSGGSFLAMTTLRVEASGKKLAATVSPNPARGSAALTFHTSQPGPVRVSVFDVAGRLVRVMMDEPSVAAGYHDVRVTTSTVGGISSGIYFLRVEATEGTTSCRVLFLK